jgi:hypothetical protein
LKLFPVSFSIGLDRFLILTGSSKKNIIGRSSESRISEAVTSDSLIFGWTTMSNTSPFPAGE